MPEPFGDDRPLHQLDDESLGRALAALSDESLPPTPDLVPAVRARTEHETPRASRRSPWAWPRPLGRASLLAILAIVALLGAVAAGVIGIGGIRIQFVDTLRSLPTAGPGGSPAPSGAGSVGRRLGLGELVALERAQQEVTFELVDPQLPEVGRPNEIYLSTRPPGGQVSFVWLPRAGLDEAPTTGVGLLLSQFGGGFDTAQYTKLLDSSAAVQRLVVNGSDAFWIEGGTHFFVTGPDGEWTDEMIRLAGNTLLWTQAGTTLRLEGAIDLERARDIAAMLAP